MSQVYGLTPTDPISNVEGWWSHTLGVKWLIHRRPRLLCLCIVYLNKETTARVVWCCLRSLSKVSDTMGFLYDQGTEKAEESGQQEAQKEGSEDAGELTGSPEKNVSVCFFHCSFTGFSSVQQAFI